MIINYLIKLLIKKLFTSFFICLTSLIALYSQTEFLYNDIKYAIISDVEPLRVEVRPKSPKYSGDIVMPSSVQYLEKTTM